MSKAEILHELYLTCQTIDFDDTNQLIEQAESDDEKKVYKNNNGLYFAEKQRKAIAESRF